MDFTLKNMYALITKIGIIFAWIALIAILLYVPHYISSGMPSKTLNIFTWPGLFDSQVLKEFEQKTGVKVNISYYDSNEELIVKLRATEGAGYDIIIPSDYTVDILKKQNLLKKLDTTKIPAFKDINPSLLHHYFDPENEYSIPYEWSIFGLGIDDEFFASKKPTGWADIFDAQKVYYPLVMPNDALLSIPFASFYLYNTIESIDREKLAAIKKLLLKQSSWVLAYIDARADYLLATKNSPLVVSSSAYIARSMLTNSYIDFVIPQEGTILTIESVAIAKNSNKDALIYQFLEFLYDPTTIKKHFKAHLFFPALQSVYQTLEAPDKIKKLIMLQEKDFEKCSFFKLSSLKDGLTEQDLQYAWMSIKK